MALPIPTIDYYDHPVFHPTTRLRLETTPMKKLRDDIRGWLWTGATGGLVLGDSRVGKSIAAQSLRNQFYTRGKVAIPGYYLAIPERDQHTITHVHRQLCYSEDLKVKARDTADHLADRYVHHLADKAVEKDCPYAVQFVDEMQRLYLEQFNAFAEIHDKLLKLEVVLTIIFVGNEQESRLLLEHIHTPQYAHIRGRFFLQATTFRGLSSHADVERCLSQYDTLRFPENGPTYTAFFLPESVERGWRLSSLSHDIWRVFREYQKQYHFDSWGMKYFPAAINMLLTDYLPTEGVENFDDDMMRACIDASGLVPSLVLQTQ
jgi:hypothetical protein